MDPNYLNVQNKGNFYNSLKTSKSGVLLKSPNKGSWIKNEVIKSKGVYKYLNDDDQEHSENMSMKNEGYSLQDFPESYDVNNIPHYKMMPQNPEYSVLDTYNDEDNYNTTPIINEPVHTDEDENSEMFVEQISKIYTTDYPTLRDPDKTYFVWFLGWYLFYFSKPCNCQKTGCLKL